MWEEAGGGVYKFMLVLVFVVDLYTLSILSSLCCLYSSPHAEMCKPSLESSLSACTHKQEKLYGQFNWNAHCPEIRADTSTWLHLKDKAERHLVLIIVIKPVKQTWKSSSVCFHKYDSCNLKHCAQIWMDPLRWNDTGMDWLRTGHDPGQDRRFGPIQSGN